MEYESEQKEEQIIREVAYPLYKNKGWLKFYGIVNIVLGVFSALSIVGLLYAWLMIWIGIIIYGAGGKIETAYESGNKFGLIEAQSKISTYFVINAVLILISIIVSALVIVAFVGGAMSGLFDHMKYDPVY